MRGLSFGSAPLAGILFLSLAGCGYTTKMALPREIRTIHVETFQNTMPVENIYAYEPGLEIKITNAIIRRLHRDGNLKVVERSEAAALLEGELTSLDQEGMRFSGLERIEEYRLYVVVNLRLRDRKTGEILWEEPSFSADTSYFVLGPRAVSRGEAVEKTIDRLARNVVDRIVEDW